VGGDNGKGTRALVTVLYAVAGAFFVGLEID
jgi:hypothetical protein